MASNIARWTLDDTELLELAINHSKAVSHIIKEPLSLYIYFYKDDNSCDTLLEYFESKNIGIRLEKFFPHEMKFMLDAKEIDGIIQDELFEKRVEEFINSIKELYNTDHGPISSYYYMGYKTSNPSKR